MTPIPTAPATARLEQRMSEPQCTGTYEYGYGDSRECRRGADGCGRDGCPANEAALAPRNRTKQWTLRLYGDEVYHHRVLLDVPDNARMSSVQATVEYSVPMIGVDPAYREPFLGIHRGVRVVTRLLPWQDVEQIAAYVRGDGTDPQRQALADGILEGYLPPTPPGQEGGVA